MIERDDLDDDQLAHRLEQVHEELINNPDSAWQFGTSAADDPAAGAECLLRLIHLAKRDSTIQDASAQNTSWRAIGDTGTADGETSPPRMDVESALPAKIGRFDVLETIGEGGFGIVVRGYDPSLRRQVAIKIPRFASLISPDARSRFVTEAKSAAALSHPSIVTVYESGQFGPACYLAVELIEGPTLARWLQDHGQPLSPPCAAKLVSILADAVQHAHDRGVIHRDIKPANIFLADSSESVNEERLPQVAKLGDFGLAKLQDADHAQTRSNSMLGTPAYMAPEQTRNNTGEANSPAVDIWGLGVLLYELLTRKTPFGRDSLIETITAIQSEEPAHPSRWNRSVSRDLDAIVQKCLEKSPSARYSSAYELQRDLENYLASRPVRARRITSLERSWRWCRNNPAIATAGAMALVGLVFSLWQWRRAETNWRQAQENLQQVASQRARAERSLDRTEMAIDQMLNDVADALKPIPRLETLRNSLLQRALALQQDLVADRADDADSRFRAAQSWRRIGELYLILGEFQSAQSALQSAEDALVGPVLSESRESDRTLELARIALKRGQLLGESASNADAETEVRRAIELFQELPAADDAGSLLSEQLSARQLLAQILESENRITEAVAVLVDALAMTETAEDAGNADLKIHRGQMLNSLGILHNRMNLPDEAESYFVQSMDLLQQVVLERPERIDLEYNVAVTAINLGNRFSRQREHSRAMEYYDRAHRIFSGLAASFPDVVKYRELLVKAGSGLGLSQLRAVDSRTGATTLQQAIDDQRLLPESVRSTADSQRELAALQQNLGNCFLEEPQDLDAAEQAYEEARDISDALRVTMPDSAQYQRLYSAALGNLAAVKRNRHEMDAARDMYREALTEAERACALDPQDRAAQSNAAWQLNRLCEVLLVMNDIDGLLESVERFVQQGSDPNPRSLTAANALALCLKSDDSSGVSQVVEDGSKTESDDSPADASRFAGLTESDRRRIQISGEDYLKQAIESGIIREAEITGSALELLRQ
jgi:tetratricopeptide (TPR) repeat protein